MKRTEPVDHGPKILVQYRKGQARVYELQSYAAVLVVEISPRDPDSDDGWHVRAHLSSDSGSAPIDGWGATRGEAFSDVARAWSAHEPELTPFDWGAVESALRTVQAL